MQFKPFLVVIVLSAGIAFGNFQTFAQEVRARKVPVDNQNPNASLKQNKPSAPINESAPLIIGAPNKSASRSLPGFPSSPQTASRPVLTDSIRVHPPLKTEVKNSPSAPANIADEISSIRLTNFEQKLFLAMQNHLGIPYNYGSDGPNSYDCSGLVWKVFQEAGYNFGRASAATYWNQFLPVSADERYKFGTLVFFNRLGHVGIVVDENGFYQASASKGVTYSSFKGYWEKRIVGFRRVPVNY